MFDSDSFIPQPRTADPRRDNAPYPPPLGGGAGGGKLFVYEISAVITTGTPSTATADIYDPDDESTLIESDASWVGNLAMFDDQAVGQRGICVKNGSVYYAVNAPCGDTSASPVGVHIGPTAPSDTSLLWIDTSGL